MPFDPHRRIADLVDRIKPILAGEEVRIQGAVLADLLAIWLASHFIPGDPAGTRALRDELLDMHEIVVRALLPINAAMIGANDA